VAEDQQLLVAQVAAVLMVLLLEVVLLIKAMLVEIQAL
jgi:hypothetical protein